MQFRWFSALAGATLTLGPGTAAADEVTVFAAASLRNAMQEIAAAWEETTPHTATVSLAGSSALARQIQQGAPADVFVSANAAWMDVLEDDGLIDPESRVALLRNALVLVAYGADAEAIEIGPGFDVAERLGEGRLAMALVDAVPAGIYGRAALESLGVWEEVAPKVAQADNVRAALALVSTGEAPLGIVYATDAAAGEGVSVAGTFPPDSHPPIVYPAAVTAAAEGEAAQAFLDFLQGEAAREAFARQGFEVVADAP